MDNLRKYFSDPKRQDLLRHKTIVIGKRRGGDQGGGSSQIRLEPDLFLPEKYRPENVDSAIEKAIQPKK